MLLGPEAHCMLMSQDSQEPEESLEAPRLHPQALGHIGPGDFLMQITWWQRTSLGRASGVGDPTKREFRVQ